jgi:hypothetical protein
MLKFSKEHFRLGCNLGISARSLVKLLFDGFSMYCGPQKSSECSQKMRVLLSELS